MAPLDAKFQDVSAALAPSPRTLADRRVWIFDLDHTLYPPHCNLFAEIDYRMGQFIEHLLGVHPSYARWLQKNYLRHFGTSLSGLMRVHRMDPKAFLDYVHEIDLSAVEPAPDLRAAIAALPGKKFIFTNGTRRHAERVSEKVGILDLFDDIFDIVDAVYTPKPAPQPYAAAVARFGIDPTHAVMFEDQIRNLAVPHALGMGAILVNERANEPVPHVHHETHDLAGFLTAILR
jgi:putative hydrolase of the HAD superfamily